MLPAGKRTRQCKVIIDSARLLTFSHIKKNSLHSRRDHTHKTTHFNACQSTLRTKGKNNMWVENGYFCRLSTLKDIYSTCGVFNVVVEVLSTVHEQTDLSHSIPKLNCVLKQHKGCQNDWVFAWELLSLMTESTIVLSGIIYSEKYGTPI